MRVQVPGGYRNGLWQRLSTAGYRVDFVGTQFNGPAELRQLLAGIRQIPDAYYEAAALDGATGWRRTAYITLPMLKPVFLLAVVLNVIGAFQVFGQPFIMTQGGPERSTLVLVMYIYETAFNNYRLGYGAAMSWLLVEQAAICFDAGASLVLVEAGLRPSFIIGGDVNEIIGELITMDPRDLIGFTRMTGDVIKAILADALGTHLDLFQRIVISPCSVTAISYGDGGPTVLSVNSVGEGPAPPAS